MPTTRTDLATTLQTLFTTDAIDPMSELETAIDDLASAFTQLPGAIIEQGPDHPDSPDEALRQGMEGYLRRYPFLLADDGYVAFVRRYWWAGTDDPGNHIHIFAPVSDLYDPYGDNPLDVAGFFTFAQTFFWRRGKPGRENSVELYFGFDATEKRLAGVYRCARLGDGENSPWSWYCASFAEWLARAIHHRGQLLD